MKGEARPFAGQGRNVIKTCREVFSQGQTNAHIRSFRCKHFLLNPLKEQDICLSYDLAYQWLSFFFLHFIR